VKYAWLAIGIFAARFFATAIAYPEVDGDLAWQRELGRAIQRAHAIPHALGADTFTASGAPWVPQEWAFSFAASLATPGLPWTLFAGGVAFAAVLSLVLTAHRAQRLGASPLAVLVCTSFAGVALFASFGVRAQVAAWPLLALFLWLLECDGPATYLAVGVAAIWSNLHASAMLAPILAALAAGGTVLDEGARSANARRRGIVTLACAVAVCCNPFGYRLPLYALGLFTAPFKAAISEWQPTDLGDTSFAFGALPLLLVLVLCFAGATERRARETFVVVAFAYLLLAATRNVALFGLVAAPFAAAALTRSSAFFARPRARASDERFSRFALPLAGAILAAVVATGLLRGESRRADNVAARAIASVVASPGEHRLLCADFSWCGLAVGSANTRVFLDGRADPYPAAVWDDYLAVVRLHRDWARTLRRRAVDAVVVDRASALDRVLAFDPGWHSTYEDASYRVWQRTPER
jgi:hypothetical protein